MPVNGLYGHIRANSWKSALLMAGFIVLVALYWWAGCLAFNAIYGVIFEDVRAETLLDAFDAIMAKTNATAVQRWYVPVVISLTWFAFSWLFYRRMIAAATGARAVERRDEPKLYNLVETLAITAGLPMPRVEIMETGELNAYAAGLTPGSSTVAVTRGLLQTLDADELEAVLAHEMTHIKNRDVRLMVVALIFAGGISFLGDLVRSLFGRGDDATSGNGGVVYYGGSWNGGSGSSWGAEGVSGASGDGGGDNAGSLAIGVMAAAIAFVAAMIIMGLAQIFATLCQLAISRSREYMADAGAVELTKNPDALISALRRISGHDDVPLASEGLRAMMISRRFEAEGALDWLYATHPPIDHRIQSLEVHASGMVRAPRRRPTARKAAGGGTRSACVVPAGPRAQFGRRGATPA